MLLARGVVLREPLALLLHAAQFLLVPQIGEAFQSVELFDERIVTLFGVLGMQLSIVLVLTLLSLVFRRATLSALLGLAQSFGSFFSDLFERLFYRLFITEISLVWIAMHINRRLVTPLELRQ